MDGGGGTDEVAFIDSYEVTVDLVREPPTEERFSDTLANFETIIGSAFADTIIGDDGPNAHMRRLGSRQPSRRRRGTTY
jgi:hypothetical protein